MPGNYSPDQTKLQVGSLKKALGTKIQNLPIGSVVKTVDPPTINIGSMSVPAAIPKVNNSFLLPVHHIPINNAYNHWSMRGRENRKSRKSRKVVRRKERKSRKN
jgi:hypothetical protein